MGGKDFFAQYAAQGRRNGSAPIHFTLASDVDKLGKCPAALLVGIDVSPEPGLRGPTNFHGIATSEFIKDLDGNLNIVRRNLRLAPYLPCQLRHVDLRVVDGCFRLRVEYESVLF